MEENENRARLKALSAMLNDEGSRKLIFLISAVMQKKKKNSVFLSCRNGEKLKE